jgi:signal transduction histidine kinase/ActR/RegA family two-component response regulator
LISRPFNLPPPSTQPASELRRRAEDQLNTAATGESLALTGHNAQRLLHELQVHQVELEMQNQALREAHVEISRNLDQLTDLYDLAPIAYLTLDRSGCITKSNAMAKRLLGSPFLGKGRGHLARFVQTESLTAYIEFITRIFSMERLESCNLPLMTAPGCPPVHVFMEGVAEKGGEECRLVVTDLTRLRATEDALASQEARSTELAAAKDAAEAANRAKATFLANMSHEIRTPMSAIVGMVHLMQKVELSTEKQMQLARIGTAARNLLGILNDILDLSKVEANQLSIEQTTFGLSGMLSDLGSLLEEKIVAKQLLLNIDFPPVLDGQRLVGDPLRLKQVLLNLLSNAVKFTTQGEIGLRVGIAAETSDDFLLSFAVSDTGCGIPAEAQERVFSAFEQADTSTTRQYGGPGLGLSISKRLVQLMGGDISLSSTPGSGSTFSFSISLKKAGGPVAADLVPLQTRYSDAEKILATRHRDKRILMAEDDEIIQEVMLSILRDEIGLQIDLAGDGTQAVALAKSTAYDLILMDVQMPLMDGLVATRAIRQLASHEKTPILAMTANAFASDRQDCVDAGMNDFISKPVAPEDLFAMLAKWLEETQRWPRAVGQKSGFLK